MKREWRPRATSGLGHLNAIFRRSIGHPEPSQPPIAKTHVRFPAISQWAPRGAPRGAENQHFLERDGRAKRPCRSRRKIRLRSRWRPWFGHQRALSTCYAPFSGADRLDRPHSSLLPIWRISEKLCFCDRWLIKFRVSDGLRENCVQMPQSRRSSRAPLPLQPAAATPKKTIAD